jgi:hypothetical protein
MDLTGLAKDLDRNVLVLQAVAYLSASSRSTSLPAIKHGGGRKAAKARRLQWRDQDVPGRELATGGRRRGSQRSVS